MNNSGSSSSGRSGGSSAGSGIVKALSAGLDEYERYQSIKLNNKAIRAQAHSLVSELAGRYLSREFEAQQRLTAIDDLQTEAALRSMRERSATQAVAAGSGLYGGSVQRVLVATGARRGVDVGKLEAQKEAVQSSTRYQNISDYRSVLHGLRSLSVQRQKYNPLLGAARITLAAFS